VTAGPYRHLRHPLYSGALLIWASLSVAFISWLVLAITVVYVLPAYLIYMRSEERMLLAHFGEPYASYRNRVGMLLPRLGHVAGDRAANRRRSCRPPPLGLRDRPALRYAPHLPASASTTIRAT